MLRILSLIGLVAVSTSVGAEEKKTAALRDFPFWSAPKMPHARAFVPGLQASLNLTAEQIQKIEAACRETIDKPEAKKKGSSGEAVEKVHKLVGDILTAEQKKKIEKQNDIYAKVSATLSEEFQDEIAANKGNDDEVKQLREKMRETLLKTYREKLVGVLSTDEMKAIEKAAEEQKKRDAVKTEKKPK